MKEKAASDHGPRRSRVGRRRFLSGVGAGGLATAVTLFGRTTSAYASNYGCCNLAYYPPNTTLSHCESVSHYSWDCALSDFSYCVCCEVRNGSSYSASAAGCYESG